MEGRGISGLVAPLFSVNDAEKAVYLTGFSSEHFSCAQRWLAQVAFQFSEVR